MPRPTVATMLLVFCECLSCLAQGPSAIACTADLEFLPGFLLENDTGARDHLAQFGQKHFDDALAAAKSAASQIRGNASCAPVIQKYLRAWRRGHLGVEDIAEVAAPAPAAPPKRSAEKAEAPPLRNAPAMEILLRNTRKTEPARATRHTRVPGTLAARSVPFALSAKTLRLTLKSFAPDHREALIGLLKAHRKDLQEHPNWIIDVRGNGGGSDSSYAPLMPWLMADEVASAGTEILATPANIEGWTRVCALAAPGDAECPKSLSDSIARMSKAAPGTYVAMNDGGAMQYDRVGRLEPRRPSRVAILIDGGCGSSCEQFLLGVRQSFHVKLIGQRTAGSLDYSNLRPRDFPSGRRRLWYATTRSTRIPGLMVDVAGVQPDIYLPAEAGGDAKNEEVRRVQNWLEGGTLAPRTVQ